MISKAIAVLTTACFMLTAVFQQALMAAEHSLQNDIASPNVMQGGLALPYSIGRITEDGSNGSAPVIIAIQDLHCHGQVQRSISRTLEAIEKQYGISRIYVEGAWGAVDTSWGKVLNARSRARVLETLVDNGRLTGAEHYSLIHERNGLLYGVENDTIYTENLSRLNEMLGNRERYDRELSHADEEIQRLSRMYLCDENRIFRKQVDRVHTSDGDIGRYYRLLADYAKQQSVPVAIFPQLALFYRIQTLQRGLDYPAVARQTRTFLAILKEGLPCDEYEQVMACMTSSNEQEAVYVHLAGIAARTGYDRDLPQLRNFFSYIRANQSINPLMLAREESSLHYSIEKQLAVSDAEREVLFLSRFVALLNDYFHNRVSADDSAYINAHWDEFALLWTKYSDIPVIRSLSADMALLRDFYRVNDQRNEIFAANMPEITEQHSGPVNVSKVTVIITGGYHTAGLVRIFKNKQVPYLVITPQVSSDSAFAQQVYERTVAEQAGIASSTLALRLYSTLVGGFADPVSLKQQVYRTFLRSVINAALVRYQRSPAGTSLSVLAGDLKNELDEITRTTGEDAGTVVFDGAHNAVRYSASDDDAVLTLARNEQSGTIEVNETVSSMQMVGSGGIRNAVAVVMTAILNTCMIVPVTQHLIVLFIGKDIRYNVQPALGIIDRCLTWFARLPMLFSKDGMSVAVVPSDKFAECAAREVAKTIRHLQLTSKRDVNLVLATGNTMVGFLNELAGHDDIDWGRIRFFHLDEYDGLKESDPASFAAYLNKNLFDVLAARGIEIRPAKKHFIGGVGPDCTWYMERLRSLGGPDIVITGTGPKDDGHIAFNMPGTPFDSTMRKVHLEKTVIDANRCDYPDIENRPFAYSMGIADILEGKYIFNFTKGTSKKEIVNDFLTGPVSDRVPVTALRTRKSNVTVILDQAAAVDLPISVFLSRIRYLLHFMGRGDSIAVSSDISTPTPPSETLTPEYLHTVELIKEKYLELSHKGISRDADKEIVSDGTIVDELRSNETRSIDICEDVLRNEPEPWVRAKTVVAMGELAQTDIESVINVLIGRATIEESLLVRSLIVRKVVPQLLSKVEFSPEVKSRVERELAAIPLNPWRQNSFRILDVGSQYGEPAHSMVRYFREIENVDDVQAVGIDPDIRAIIEADRLRLTRAYPDDVVFMYGVASDNPQAYRTGPADMVFSMNLLLYVDEIKKHSVALAYECAPGGTICFTPSIGNTDYDNSGEDGQQRLAQMTYELKKMKPQRPIYTEYQYTDPFEYSKHYPKTNVFGSPCGDSAGWVSSSRYSISCDGRPLRIRSDNFPDGEHKLRFTNVSLLEKCSEVTLFHPVENASDYVAIELLLNMVRLYAPKGVKIKLEIDRPADTDKLEVFVPFCHEICINTGYSKTPVTVPQPPPLVKKNAPLTVDMMVCQHDRFIGDAQKAAATLKVPYGHIEVDKSKPSPLDWHVTLPDNIQGKNIMLVHSCENATDIAELWLMLSELRKAGVGSITLINSYEGYSRQDKLFAQGEGINAIALLAAIDQYVDVHMALNLHYGDGSGMMVKGDDKLGHYQIFNLNAFVQVAEKLFDRFAACVGDANIIEELKKHPWLLISPDKGSIKRVRAIVPVLRKYIQKYILEKTGVLIPLEDIPVASGFLGKKRISGTKVVVTGPVKTIGANGAAVELNRINDVSISDSWAFIVDDEVAHGSTQLSAVYCLHESIGIHPLRIMAGVVHGKLTAGYDPFNIGMAPENTTAMLASFEKPLGVTARRELMQRIHKMMKYDPKKAQMAPVELVATESVDLRGKLLRKEQVVNIDRLFVYAAELLATGGIYGTTNEDVDIQSPNPVASAKRSFLQFFKSQRAPDIAVPEDVGWEDEPLRPVRLNRFSSVVQSVLSWLSDPHTVGPRVETTVFPLVSSIFVMSAPASNFASFAGLLWITVGFSLFHMIRETYQRSLSIPLIDHMRNIPRTPALDAFFASGVVYDTPLYRFERAVEIDESIMAALEKAHERGDHYVLVRVDNELNLYATSGKLIQQAIIPSSVAHTRALRRAIHPRFWAAAFIKRAFLGALYSIPFILPLQIATHSYDLVVSLFSLGVAWYAAQLIHGLFNTYRTMAVIDKDPYMPSWLLRVFRWLPLTTIATPTVAVKSKPAQVKYHLPQKSGRPHAHSILRSTMHGADDFVRFSRLSPPERVAVLQHAAFPTPMAKSLWQRLYGKIDLGDPFVKGPAWETVVFPGIGIGGAVLLSLNPAFSALGILWATLAFSFTHTVSEWITRARAVKLLRIVSVDGTVDDRFVGKTDIVFMPATPGVQLPASYPSQNGRYTLILAYSAENVSMAAYTPAGMMMNDDKIQTRTVLIDTIDLKYDAQDMVLVRQPKFWLRELCGRLTASFVFAVPFVPAMFMNSVASGFPVLVLAAKVWIIPALISSYVIHSALNTAIIAAADEPDNQSGRSLIKKYIFSMRHAPMSAVRSGRLTPEQRQLLDSMAPTEAEKQNALRSLLSARPSNLQVIVDHIVKNKITAAIGPMVDTLKQSTVENSYSAGYIAEGLSMLYAREASPYMLKYIIEAIRRDPSIVMGDDHGFYLVTRAFIRLADADDTVFTMIRLSLDPVALHAALSADKVKSPALRNYLTQASGMPFYRLTMAKMLEECRNAGATALLSRLAKDNDPAVRKAAERAQTRLNRDVLTVSPEENETVALWLKLSKNGAPFQGTMRRTYAGLYGALLALGNDAILPIEKTMRETDTTASVYQPVLQRAYDDIRAGKTIEKEPENPGVLTSAGRMFELNQGGRQKFQQGYLRVTSNAVECTGMGSIVRVDRMSKNDTINFYDHTMNLVDGEQVMDMQRRMFDIDKTFHVQAFIGETENSVTFLVPQRVVNALRNIKGFSTQDSSVTIEVRNGSRAVLCTFTALRPEQLPVSDTIDSASWFDNIDYTAHSAWWIERLFTLVLAVLSSAVAFQAFPVDPGHDTVRLFTAGFSMLTAAVLFFSPHVISRGLRKSVTPGIIGLSLYNALNALPFIMVLFQPAAGFLYSTLGCAMYMAGTVIQRRIDLSAVADPVIAETLSSLVKTSMMTGALNPLYDRQFWMNRLWCTETEASRVVSRFIELAAIVELSDSDDAAVLTTKAAQMLYLLRTRIAGRKISKKFRDIQHTMLLDMIPYVNVQDVLNGKTAKTLLIDTIQAFRRDREPCLEFVDAQTVATDTFVPRTGFVTVFVQEKPADITPEIMQAESWIELSRFSKIDAMINPRDLESPGIRRGRNAPAFIEGGRVIEEASGSRRRSVTGSRTMCSAWAHKEILNGNPVWVISYELPSTKGLTDPAMASGSMMLAVKELFDSNPIIKRRLGLGALWTDRLFLKHMTGSPFSLVPGVIRSENHWADPRAAYAGQPGRLARHQSTVFEANQLAEHPADPHGGLKRRIAELRQRSMRQGLNVALIKSGDSLVSDAAGTDAFAVSLIAAHRSMPFDSTLITFEKDSRFDAQPALWQNMNQKLKDEGITSVADIAFDISLPWENRLPSITAAIHAGFGGIVLHFNGNEDTGEIARQVNYALACNPDLRICLTIDRSGYDYKQLSPLCTKTGAVLMVDVAYEAGRVIPQKGLIELLRSQGISVLYTARVDTIRAANTENAMDITQELSSAQPWGVAIPATEAVSALPGFDHRVWDEQIMALISERLAAVMKSTENSYEASYLLAWNSSSVSYAPVPADLAAEWRSVIRTCTLWKQNNGDSHLPETQLKTALSRFAYMLRAAGPSWDIPAALLSDDIRNGNLDAASGFLAGLYTLVLYQENTPDDLPLSSLVHRKLLGETILGLQLMYGERSYSKVSTVKFYRNLYEAYHSAYVQAEGDLAKINSIMAPLDNAVSSASTDKLAGMASLALRDIAGLKASAAGISDSTALDAQLKLLALYVLKNEIVQIRENGWSLIVRNVKKVLGAA